MDKTISSDLEIASMVHHKQFEIRVAPYRSGQGLGDSNLTTISQSIKSAWVICPGIYMATKPI